ncbi:SGNH hydrolase [Plenodomus tracheiphilus IPT5]|uniref:SGNH hydrolase n=1 Tax=Plenodomus tracheiphilus IPT5 TaxID=1408161 RepID=A0A6A7AW89_9PLEO|nr:SGNH hydrolase [Plenodomus tracheiphilus IPT5]
MLFSRLALLLVGAVASVQGDDATRAANVARRTIRPNPSSGHWVDAWATMPQLTEPANLPPAPFNQTGAVFVNSTIRQTLFMTAAAGQIPGIHQIQSKTVQKVTFSGRDSISIPNGALAVSDPLNFKISAQQVITVTVYLATGQLTNSVTSHPGSRTTSFFQFGNAVSAPSIAITDPNTQSAAHWYFLSSIEAWVPPKQSSLLIIGDSITDGRGSTTNANNRWPDLLLARLQKSPSTNHISIGNLAAGGNRILADGLGPNAFSRIDRDVLAHPGVAYALLFEGVNDIGTAPNTTTAQDALYTSLTQTYTQIATLIHAHNIPLFAATITPFSAPANFTGQPYSDTTRERTRQRINAWIRSSGVFDAVVDFDAFLRDQTLPSQLRTEFDSGDYLHPNPRGYRELAERFPVQVFAEWEGGVGGFF